MYQIHEVIALVRWAGTGKAPDDRNVGARAPSRRRGARIRAPHSSRAAASACDPASRHECPPVFLEARPWRVRCGRRRKGCVPHSSRRASSRTGCPIPAGWSRIAGSSSASRKPGSRPGVPATSPAPCTSTWSATFPCRSRRRPDGLRCPDPPRSLRRPAGSASATTLASPATPRAPALLPRVSGGCCDGSATTPSPCSTAASRRGSPKAGRCRPAARRPGLRRRTTPARAPGWCSTLTACCARSRKAGRSSICAAPSASAATSSRSTRWPATCPARSTCRIPTTSGRTAASVRRARSPSSGTRAPGRRPAARRSACAAPASPPARACSRSRPPASTAPGSTAAPGANGSATRPVRSRADRLDLLSSAPSGTERGRDLDSVTRGQVAPRAPWSVEDSEQIYSTGSWGSGYFGINAAGHVVCRPSRGNEREIDLYEVVRELEARDLTAPMVLRFSDILRDRLRSLHDAFASAIAENDYKNRYAAVFPIKVNQQRLVVEEVYRGSADLGFGLEAGSKPELLAVMAMTGDAPERLIICNGFKDDDYIEAVILATKLGRAIIPVVENFSELGYLLKHAEKYQVRPKIGVRVKLAAEGAGRWRESAGDRSKFGLFTTEILELVEVLRSHGMLDCLKLVHCHPGSQLHDIRRVKDAVNELAMVYAELARLGAGLEYIDVGGGLGIDYDGSRTNFESSTNYSLREYANDVVYRVASVCNARGLPHPVILSESGRAIAAHHSVLLFNVLGAARLDLFSVPERPRGGSLPQPVEDLYDAHATVSERRLVECWHDAQQAREQAHQMFSVGYLTIEMRSLAERLYWATCAKVRDLTRKLGRAPEELEDLETILSDIYFCNMSVFQSLPDSWAIDQLFPSMPLHRLDERPARSAVLADITCDSDGKIDRFVSQRETKRTLEVHELVPGQEYYLGAFLVGAYQETLGDLHNLFGDTHVVHVRFHDDGGWWIEEVVKGDTANKVLEYMEYDVADLHPALVRDCERAVREGRMTVAEAQGIKRFYEGELNGYAYLE